jgi:hypothetical protein
MVLGRRDTRSRSTRVPDEQQQNSLELLRSKETEIWDQGDRLRSKASKQELAYNVIGYFTVATSLALGGSLGSTFLANGGLLADSPLWRGIGAGLGFLSALAAAVQTRGHFAEQARANNQLATAYTDIGRTVQRYLASYSDNPDSVDDPPPVHLEWVDERLRDFQQQEGEIGPKRAASEG